LGFFGGGVWWWAREFVSVYNERVEVNHLEVVAEEGESCLCSCLLLALIYSSL
jgi:hypothetical protein